ncbi:MAG: hypothetical protein HY334_04385 [Armatimonadetes bacterium]|nr:hypothetical protein [Armatimonadota bacterium]
MVASDYALRRDTMDLPDVGARKFHMRDILPTLGGTAAEVNYTRLTGCSNSAGGVVEAVAKPESQIVATVMVKPTASCSV